METYKERIRSWIGEHGLEGIAEFNRRIIDELERQPLQLAVLGQQTAAKQSFVRALAAADGSFLPPPNSSVFMSRNLSRMPSCESINCPVTDPNLVPGLARMMSDGGGGGEGKPKPKLNNKPLIGPFILEKVKLSIDESILSDPALNQLREEDIHEALAKIQTAPKEKKLDLGVHDMPDTFHADLSHAETLNDDLRYDGFLISIGSRYIRRPDLEIAQWCSQFHRRRSMLIYTNLSPSNKNNSEKNDSNAADEEEKKAQNQVIKRYYREKLFKHKLSDISLFMVDGNSQDYDYSDLLRILLKWDKRKAHRRKHALVKIEKDFVSSSIAEQKRYSIGPAVFCGLMSGLPQDLPVGSALSDLGLAVIRYGWFPSLFHTRAELPTLDDLKALESTRDKLLYVAIHCPCSLLFLVQLASKMAFESSFPSVHSAVCGLVAGVGYVATQTILHLALDTLKVDAFTMINESVGDTT